MRTETLKVLVITNLFPNNIEKNRGIFIKQSLQRINGPCDIRVVAPVPWFPLNIKFLSNWSVNSLVSAEEEIAGIKTYHPRWLVIPKMMRSMYGFLMFACILPGILKVRKSFDFDVIYGHWIYPDGFASALLAKILKVPVVLHARGCDINQYTRFYLRRKMITWAVKNARSIITVSRQLKENVVKLGIEPEKIIVVQNGVDTGIFKPMDRNECRSKLGLNKEEKIILFIGTVEEVKGVEYLIEAFKKIRDRGVGKIRLIVIGKGALENKIKEKTAGYGLSDIVDFVREIPHAEVPLWINSCDVFCLPSIREGMPNVILETLSCRRPVVATDVGGIPDIMNSAEYGLLVPPRDPEALAGALIRLLSEGRKEIYNPETVLSWGEHAEKIIKELNAAAGNRE
ncbi:MAG TPA: hypothetical protein DEE98_01830 [Elusimicrobia bacterium]|nr:MAG: hypothetical protein A2278_05630 [Elusimicrobia bacterium RIFOXYA12_FULL_49_49]OGS15388.1 MAG: hypothetical protein A2251_07460 [Elusimicrobia bacterium RIFOXYA2_FULL_47_53]OGS26272.1 MAG: hypothetical protein A2339_01600 [Elusimicrobia bacterium RIFOXYB12_FULL_50_12]OGS30816.1 MAG: hypothetical protein A2323_00600 [Elusimicrobia bacterium RIFOXYB2_FULL_46_23]HBU69102.1 hypothetical protein [Elusimicrobiota bacterium]